MKIVVANQDTNEIVNVEARPRAKVEILAVFDTKLYTCEFIKKIVHDYFLDYWNNRRICSFNDGLPPAIKRDIYFMKLEHTA